nr:hypothetical protein [Pseudomonadota bacterium]
VLGKTISISATYKGQTSITTLGTITAGTWNGTVISLAKGGTGADFSTRTANTVWAGPVSGLAAAPAFRALVAADIPSLAGTYQPLDATLTALAGANWSVDAVPIGTGVDTVSQVTFAANTFLGKGAGALTAIAVGVDQLIGRTGSAALGIINKLDLPINTATQAALDLKAPLASPSLTAIPTAPTAAAGTNTTQLATTAFVQAFAATASFTPTVVGSTTAGTGTYSAQLGKYTKIGNMVSFKLFVQITAHTGTGNLRIGGLPFTSSNDGFDSAVSIGYVDNLALTAANVPTAIVLANSSQIGLFQTPTGGGATTAVPLDTAFVLEIAGVYFA